MTNQNLGLPFHPAPQNTDLKDCMAWITFMDNNWEKIWFPLVLNGKHLRWNSHFCMEIARDKFGEHCFGISCTEQMLFQNAQRDNL